jgi:drug/metabolite transporter (DMT)-like permease
VSLGFLSAGELYSLACAFVWAIAVLLFRKSGERVAPVALNLFKNSVGLALFVATMLVAKMSFVPASQTARDWLVLLASGAIGIGIADSLFFASLNRLGATNSAIVDCLYSPFVIVCAFVYLREPLGPSLLAACALMVGAILVGTREPRTGGAGPGGWEGSGIGAGVALGVVSMFLMAAGIVLAKPVLADANAWWATTVRLAGGTAVLGVQALSRRNRGEVARCFRPGPAWAFTVPAALCGSYVALILWILGMKYAPASVASVLNQMSAIFVLVLAGVFLRERVTMRKVAAVAMAVTGAVLVAL